MPDSSAKITQTDADGRVVWEGYPPAAQDREAELYADIELVRRSLNQLTDHGSQHCLDCQKHRQDGMDALDRLERGMRWMERRDGYEAVGGTGAPAFQNGWHNFGCAPTAMSGRADNASQREWKAWVFGIGFGIALTLFVLLLAGRLG